MSSTPSILRLGTRGSLLARSQSQLIANWLMRLHVGLRVELVIIKTSGDRVQDKPLADIGGKGLFTKELEQA
jgi:porphobilinogen deaminase